MSMRERSFWRLWAPTPAALVLASLLVIGSSCSHVADGVRTAPHDASGPTGDAGGVLDGRGAYKPDRHRAEDDEAAGSVLVVVVKVEEELRGLKGRVATGSRPPDCAHACGPCSPCRRVMVSFRCAQASESCPIAYRCMCRGRFFRVPSL